MQLTKEQQVARLMVSILGDVSSSKERAEEYLRSEGIDVEAIAKHGTELMLKYQDALRRPIDISEHPLIEQAYNLCLEVEKLIPSEQSTNLSVAASDLLKKITTQIRFSAIREQDIRERPLIDSLPSSSLGKMEWRGDDNYWDLIVNETKLGCLKKDFGIRNGKVAHFWKASTKIKSHVIVTFDELKTPEAKQWVEQRVLSELRSLGTDGRILRAVKEGMAFIGSGDKQICFSNGTWIYSFPAGFLHCTDETKALDHLLGKD